MMRTQTLARGLAFTVALSTQALASAAPVRVQLPLELRVETPPTPFVADAKTHLVYELRLTDFDRRRDRELQVLRLDVLGDDSAVPIATYEAAALTELLARPRLTPAPADPRRLRGGEHAVAFLWITLPAGQVSPHELRHRVRIGSEGWKETVDLEGAPTTIAAQAAEVIDPPLRGGDWLTANGPSNGASEDQHRRALTIANGAVHLPQRLAIDWTRLGDDGRLVHGDPAHNTSWQSYGEPVLAVADGRIIDVRDGIPENAPGETAVEITLDTLGGNYLVLDLGHGHFADYFHLQPGSFTVHAGERVHRGQILARVGNSGSSDAPHLHFQVTDGPIPLGSEGVPFVLRTFEELGTTRLPDDPEKLIEAVFRAAAAPVLRTGEMPLENTVVRFEESGARDDQSPLLLKKSASAPKPS